MARGLEGYGAGVEPQSIGALGAITEPTLVTLPATNITINSATLNAEVTSMGGYSSFNLFFSYRYWNDDPAWEYEGGWICPNINYHTNSQTVTKPGLYSMLLKGLDPGKEHIFCALTENDVPQEMHNIVFTTATATTIETKSPVNITSTSATLNGNLFSKGSASSIQESFALGKLCYIHPVFVIHDGGGTTWGINVENTIAQTCTWFEGKSQFRIGIPDIRYSQVPMADYLYPTPLDIFWDIDPYYTIKVDQNNIDLLFILWKPREGIGEDWVGISFGSLVYPWPIAFVSYGWQDADSPQRGYGFPNELSRILAHEWCHSIYWWLTGVLFGFPGPGYPKSSLRPIQDEITTYGASIDYRQFPVATVESDAYEMFLDGITPEMYQSMDSSVGLQYVGQRTTSNTGAFSLTLPTGSLSSGTHYCYRSKAVGDRTTYGSCVKFTTIGATPIPPAVLTLYPTNLTTSSVILNGEMLSMGTYPSLSIYFEYGLTTSYGTVTGVSTVTDTGVYSSTVPGTSGQTYHYRFVAKSGNTVVAVGSDMTYTIIKLTSITTNPATSVTSGSALLNGYVNTVGSSEIGITEVSFEWGPTVGYGNGSNHFSLNSPGSFSYNLTNLTSNITYHFRSKALNVILVYSTPQGQIFPLESVTYGSDKSFTTTAPTELELQLDSIKTYFAMVNGYNAITKSYYVPTKLVEGVGYWIAVTADCTLQMPYMSIPLKAGWNLITWLQYRYVNDSANVTTQLNSIISQSQLAGVYGFDPVNKGYIPLWPNTASTQLKVGAAYWVAVFNKCNVIYGGFAYPLLEPGWNLMGWRGVNG